VEDTPDDTAQSNLTEPELHIMRTNNKGWEYCGNAPVSVEAAWQIIVACEVTAAPNDKQQAEPVAQATLAPLAQAGIERPTAASGTTHAIPATLDNGYYREAAVEALETFGFDPSIATARQRHHGPQADVPETPTTGQERMAAKVRRPQARRCTPDARSLWNPCLARSKKRRGSAASYCVAWTTSVVNGLWSA
jgi:hypothetical protein